MQQLELFAARQPGTPLTVADIDEWTAATRATTNPHSAAHWPNEWARTGLGALLGEDIPHRRWSTRELLGALARARVVAVEREREG